MVFLFQLLLFVYCIGFGLVLDLFPLSLLNSRPVLQQVLPVSSLHMNLATADLDQRVGGSADLICCVLSISILQLNTIIPITNIRLDRAIQPEHPGA